MGGLFSIFHQKSASKAPKTCDFAYFTSQWGGLSPPAPPWLRYCIDMFTKKLSRAVGILCKLQSFLNKTTLLNLYYALFHSHIQYGLLAWSAIYKSYYNKISILQNKAVKIVGGGKWNDKATLFYANLIILKLSDLVQLHKAIFVFNFKSNKVPSTCKNYFKAACNIHIKQYQKFQS